VPIDFYRLCFPRSFSGLKQSVHRSGGITVIHESFSEESQFDV
jgi:hypothetical protein